MKKKISILRNLLSIIRNAEIAFYINDKEEYWVHIYPESIEIQDSWVGPDGFQHQQSWFYGRDEAVYSKLINLLKKAKNCTISTYMKRYEI